MRIRSSFQPGILAAFLCLLLVCCMSARAEDVKVSAAISDSDTDAGQSVDYTITVDGASDASVPENINVEGLQITYEGPSTQTSINFGTGFGSGSHIHRSVIHTYSVVAQRNGEFIIPAQQVVVDGRTYTTAAVDLKVGGGGTASSGGGSSGAGQGSSQQTGTGKGKLYYAEFVLPRDTAYVGEALPIEIRLYIDSRVRAQLEEMPEITAEGCTVEKTTKPEQVQVTRDGREYIMLTYKTAVTAAKAGKLKVGPVTVQAQAQLPELHRRMGGPFNDPFFQNFDDAFQMMTPPQQITIRGEPVELTANPLPAEGQPHSFAGAVGNFSLTTTVSPTTVQAGDPITITAKVVGRGNFDRVTAPEIVNPDGWKTYPPSAKFEGDDDVGISGAKTFQIAAIPEQAKTASPALEWSYFDPIKERYVTLNEKGWPIKVEGAIHAAAPVVAAQATPAQSQTLDILYIRADSTGWNQTFVPLYMNHTFWAAQGAPLVALLAFIGIGVVQKRAADQQARVRAQLKREKDIAVATMQRRDLPEGELYQAATRALRLEAAMQTGRSPETLDGSDVASARKLDPAMEERVRRLFDWQAEVLYAGTSGRNSAASSETRAEALETVRGYENAKPAV